MSAVFRLPLKPSPIRNGRGPGGIIGAHETRIFLRDMRGKGELYKVQPTYLTLSSSGSSPWKLANWHATSVQQFGFQVNSTGGSNFQIDATLEDPTGTYPNPNSSTPTTFTLATASSTAATPFTVGVSSIAIAAWRLTLNAPSSAGAKVTLVGLQVGIG
jgi:hypothetical protein